MIRAPSVSLQSDTPDRALEHVLRQEFRALNLNFSRLDIPILSLQSQDIHLFANIYKITSAHHRHHGSRHGTLVATALLFVPIPHQTLCASLALFSEACKMRNVLESRAKATPKGQ